MKLSTAFFCICCISIAAAQSFITAIGAYPQLSNFATLYRNNSFLASKLLTGSPTNPQTVLIPNNTAFANYQLATGRSLLNLSVEELQTLLSYHVLVGGLTSTDFAQPAGITVPSLLVGEQYDNRTGGAALASVGGTSASASHDGQVVFISAKVNSTGSFGSGQSQAVVRSGLGNTVNLTTVDGTWDGGRFHIIDGFLTLPEVCTKTIRANGLTSLDLALNRTALASVLDHLSNVTCLGPTDAAFLAAGSPDVKANASDLTSALLFHTIPQPLYSNFLVHGQEFKTANDQTVRISVVNGSIYFNDAKVIKPNVITNNGIIHQLDRVMSPLATNASSTSTASSSGSPTATGTAASTSRATSTPTGGASSINSPPSRWGVTGLLGAAILLIL